MSAEIDWDTYEPTRAVRAASMTLFTADAVEAMCFGWVPQAREALAVALDVEEMVQAILPSLDNYWCGDHIEYHETDDEGETPRCCTKAREDQARETATALRTTLLGATP